MDDAEGLLGATGTSALAVRPLLGAPARANTDPLAELRAHALQLAGITICK
jgi:hypothetical protein